MRTHQSPISIHLLLLFLLGLSCVPAPAQGDVDVSINTNRVLKGQEVHVVLTWPAIKSADEISQFNLYRKTNPSRPYPADPINGRSPISVMTDCSEIQELINPGSPEWETLSVLLGSEAEEFDPCNVSGIPRDSTQFERLQLLARGNWKIAVLVGQGYDDRDVENNTSYFYQLGAINSQGEETIVMTDVGITAGSPPDLKPPRGFDATTGDNQVLLLWDPVMKAAGYNLYRSLSPSGAYQRINDASFTTQITHDLNGDPLPESSLGFVDFQRWTPEGEPDTHEVDGADIPGRPMERTIITKWPASICWARKARSLTLQFQPLPSTKHRPWRPLKCPLLPITLTAKWKFESPQSFTIRTAI